MSILGRSGTLVPVSTRDLAGAVLARPAALLDVGLAGCGYRVYANGGLGPVDLANPVATVSTNARHWRKASLSHPACWRVVVRAFNAAAGELNLDRAASLTLDDAGLARSDGPNSPLALAARPAPDGAVSVSFSYDADRQPAPATHFHLYHDHASGRVDYDSLVAEIPIDSGNPTHYAVTVSGLTAGLTYRFAVRTAGADDVEDTGTQFVEAIPDAVAPDQPSQLSASLTP